MLEAGLDVADAWALLVGVLDVVVVNPGRVVAAEGEEGVDVEVAEGVEGDDVVVCVEVGVTVAVVVEVVQTPLTNV